MTRVPCYLLSTTTGPIGAQESHFSLLYMTICGPQALTCTRTLIFRKGKRPIQIQIWANRATLCTVLRSSPRPTVSWKRSSCHSEHWAQWKWIIAMLPLPAFLFCILCLAPVGVWVQSGEFLLAYSTISSSITTRSPAPTQPVTEVKKKKWIHRLFSYCALLETWYQAPRDVHGTVSWGRNTFREDSSFALGPLSFPNSSRWEKNISLIIPNQCEPTEYTFFAFSRDFRQDLTM